MSSRYIFQCTLISDGVLSVIDLNNRYRLDSVLCLDSVHCSIISGFLTVHSRYFRVQSYARLTAWRAHNNFSCTQHNVWCNIYSHVSLMSISVHRKFHCVIVNWSTLDFKIFLKHILGRVKNIPEQLQNTA